MNAHQLAELLPSMSDAELQHLADDIRAHGLRDPIVEYEGQILDGRHRYKACVMAGVAPRFTAFTGDDAAAAAFVCSANLMRRQLTKSQLAMAGAALKAWHAMRAKERQLEAVRRGNKTRHGESPVRVNSPELAEGRARDHAAKAVGVGGQLIDQAENVMRKAVPEVARLVESGAMTLNEASKVADLPKDTQRRIAVQPTKLIRRNELRAALKKSRAGKKARATQARSSIAQAADAPGTPLVRTLLSRLELLANEIDRHHMTPQAYAAAFVEQFDWSEPLMVSRMEYVSKAIDMIATLQVMGKQAGRRAA
jgi:hypothetical protein